MQDSAKYLIHADIKTDGVVERSDVVGAIFGQTEGLLGDDLDLRDLQQSSKVGRIDVQIRSENGQSFGEVTIASGLDKIETAILAAALETIDRVGPCRSDFEVTKLEDVRAAKRREVVDRATDLLSSFEDDVMSSEDLVEEVRQEVRVADITEYEGLPAGPRVADSDAIIVVEGRADVLQLLQYGIKNAIAVEGTNVPDAVAGLTRERTVTAFLDGDRGGDLILKELRQVGNIDYAAFAPEGRSVEDLSRDEIMSGLREKVPFEVVADASTPHELAAATDGSTRPAPPEATGEQPAADAPSHPDGPDERVDAPSCEPEATTAEEPQTDRAEVGTGADDADSTDDTEQSPADTAAANDDTADDPAATGVGPGTPDEPETIAGHVHAVIGKESESVVLLDSEFGRVGVAPASDAFDAIADSEQVPAAVILDGELTQRVLDVAAQRGVEQVVAQREGQYVKKPTNVRVRTADQFEIEANA
ncbi:DNA primase DnaG [Halorientalis brevis]|uniref:DNA primase DnaG n=1 Tax=Halorientalis brevis TaxID=1126241 RepID=A0ABD6C5F1_9EURY|nr:DNA primase DnaG [Halorientalis brevis]